MASRARSFSSRKRSHGSASIATEQSNYKTKAIQVENELRRELHGAFFAETPRFLDTFFPIKDDKITKIYKAMGDSLWSEFPDSSDANRKEKAYYAPFAKLANAIHAACGKEARSGLRWLSDPNRTPPSYDTKAADLRPDIVAALEGPDTPEDTSAKPSAPTQVPWHQILVPMEVKKDNRGAAMQLFTYIRQVFHESVDRRFVFGLVLADRNITIYLADRSGVLGSTCFDMQNVSPSFPLCIALADRIVLHRIVAR